MKDIIIPAVLPKEFWEVEELASGVSSMVPLIQVDLCDGVFVPSKTWPFLDTSANNIQDDFEMPGWEYLDYEFDLMVANPHQYIEMVKNMAASRVVLHLDSEPDNVLLETAIAYHNYDIEIGFGFQNMHSHSRLTSLIEKFEEATGSTPYVQVMGIERIGMQRQPFDAKTLETLSTLKKELPTCILQVDGAVNKDTISDLHSHGAARFVVGSAMKSMENVPEALMFFKSLVI